MLSPVSASPWLWQSNQWSPGQPGLFAVVIGISAYDHLDGGTAPVPTTYGLKQLEVSAITAYRFSRWLADKYKHSGIPLAQCWLLLAPTAKEIAFESALNTHALKPTLANCEQAIGQWFVTMKALSLGTAQASRSVFLFSGHGLEIFEDKQLLLPADYLSPPISSVSNAISTQNLARGLKALTVPRHFFFLDACRNDHDSLGNFSSLDGKVILNELKNSLNNPDCLVPLFYASAAGTQAFQPQDPAKDTLFGGALLEGLSAQGLEPDCGSGVCVVDLNRLEPFVRDRVVAVMRDDYKATSFQRVRLRGDHVDDPLTEVAAAKFDRGVSGKPSGTIARLRVDKGFGFIRLDEGAELVFHHSSVRGGDFELLREGQRVEFTPEDSGKGLRVADVAPVPSVTPTPTPTASAATVRTFSVATPDWVPAQDGLSHHNLGSEYMTAILAKARIYDLQTKRWRPVGQGVVVDAVSRDPETRTFQLTIRVQNASPGHKYWFELNDFARKFGSCLLEDQSGNTAFRVELDLDYTNGSGGPRPLSRMDVSLSESNDLFAGYASKMWDRYEKDNASVASEEVFPDMLGTDDTQALQDLIRHKNWSPINAAVGALILIRVRRWEQLHDWLRNLADLFPEFPDGAVLWTEQCLQQPKPFAHPLDALPYLLRLETGPLPLLGETLGYADRQVHDFLAIDGLPPGATQRLEETHKRMQRVLAWYRPGGLFATFAGPVDRFPDPESFQSPY